MYLKVKDRMSQARKGKNRGRQFLASNNVYARNLVREEKDRALTLPTFQRHNRPVSRQELRHLALDEGRLVQCLPQVMLQRSKEAQQTWSEP